MKLKFAGFLTVLGLLACANSAKTEETTFHFMMIREVFGGTTAAPDAQYVMLQMYFAGQNLVDGHDIIVYDSAGNQIKSFTFAGSVANGNNQAVILIATAAASSFFGVTANLVMDTAAISPRGGKVCFDAIDCVAWGNYIGSSVGVGTPFNKCEGLEAGKAARRIIVGLLDPSDDTNNSENDFTLATPAPRNNANQSGTIPPSTCSNGVVEGLEQCDDNNGDDGDGCSSSCEIEPPFCANIKGDLNGSTDLTPADVVLMLICVFTDPTGCGLCYTDVNSDGNLTPSDVVLELSAVFNGAPFPPC
ncbi:MAG: hypothetical protein L0Z48_06595 [candidate division Zixibacteria bacterium]|nr:hypothetical protein [candidate division Zixibacteria bacterium]MCI0596193.1 hypothetical protein [candidate division Zixibacteria bacterium]